MRALAITADLSPASTAAFGPARAIAERFAARIYSPMDQLTLGTTAGSVIHGAPCPVLVVKGAVRCVAGCSP
ncbi:MAG: hypothetical protein HY721_25510 [Planctomycetes bacterium]|nr:hypothetical protein [Planctomycetota bacterium]